MTVHSSRRAICCITGFVLAPLLSAQAAERIALQRLEPTSLRSDVTAPDAASTARMLKLDAGSTLRELTSRTDRKGLRHQRFQQMHHGVPVFGEHIITATDSAGRVTRLSGASIHALQADIASVSPTISADRAMATAQQATERGISGEHRAVRDAAQTLMIHLDHNDQARLAWVVDFVADLADGGAPTRPITIIDAASGVVLDRWDALAHVSLGTGPGGNTKTGMHEYGGNKPALDIQVDGPFCTLQSANVRTINLNNGTSGNNAHTFSCPRNTVRAINGAFAPLNDAHHAGNVVFALYRQWLNIAPLPFQLRMRVHYGRNYDNAFWDGSSMTFGDGASIFYPLVSLDVAAHEVSHGFTEVNSGLIYQNQSGGMNEAFSDMAGEAAEFFSDGRADFLVAESIVKNAGALRYMADPERDGKSIAHARNYVNGMNVHHSSGVYNKAFHLLATSRGWDVKKAFLVFAGANLDYWTPNSTFNEGACGVLYATQDLGYATADVKVAFEAVGVRCGA